MYLLRKSRQLHGRIEFNGLQLSIETGRSRIRQWSNPHDGSSGMSRMTLPYGYIKGTVGTDGDHVDCFVGPDRTAPEVYVVHTMKAPDFIEYDEDKCIIGVGTPEEAKRVFDASYNDPRFFGGMSVWSFEEFREALQDKGKKLEGERKYIAPPESENVIKCGPSRLFTEQEARERARVGSIRKSKAKLVLKQETDKHGFLIHRWERDGIVESTELVADKLHFIDRGEPICSVNRTDMPIFDDKTDAVIWITEYWGNKYGGGVKNRILGGVQLDNKAARDSVGHMNNDLKPQALMIAPRVIQEGVLLGKLPDSPPKPTAYLIGAPVEIDGERFKLFVLVRRDKNKQRMYLHRLMLQKNAPSDAFQSPAATAIMGTVSHRDVAEPQSNGAPNGAIDTLLHNLRNNKFTKSLRSGLWLRKSKSHQDGDKSLRISAMCCSIDMMRSVKYQNPGDSRPVYASSKSESILLSNSRNSSTIQSHLQKSDLPSGYYKPKTQSDELEKAHYHAFDRVELNGSIQHVRAHDDSRVRKYGDKLVQIRSHADLHKLRSERFGHLPNWGSLSDKTKKHILDAEDHIHYRLKEFDKEKEKRVTKKPQAGDKIDQSGWTQDRMFKAIATGLYLLRKKP